MKRWEDEATGCTSVNPSSRHINITCSEFPFTSRGGDAHVWWSLSAVWSSAHKSNLQNKYEILNRDLPCVCQCGQQQRVATHVWADLHVNIRFLEKPRKNRKLRNYECYLFYSSLALLWWLPLTIEFPWKMWLRRNQFLKKTIKV